MDTFTLGAAVTGGFIIGSLFGGFSVFAIMTAREAERKSLIEICNHENHRDNQWACPLDQ